MAIEVQISEWHPTFAEPTHFRASPEIDVAPFIPAGADTDLTNSDDVPDDGGDQTDNSGASDGDQFNMTGSHAADRFAFAAGYDHLYHISNFDPAHDVMLIDGANFGIDHIAVGGSSDEGDDATITFDHNGNILVGDDHWLLANVVNDTDKPLALTGDNFVLV